MSIAPSPTLSLANITNNSSHLKHSNQSASALSSQRKTAWEPASTSKTNSSSSNNKINNKDDDDDDVNNDGDEKETENDPQRQPLQTAEFPSLASPIAGHAGNKKPAKSLNFAQIVAQKPKKSTSNSSEHSNMLKPCSNNNNYGKKRKNTTSGGGGSYAPAPLPASFVSSKFNLSEMISGELGEEKEEEEEKKQINKISSLVENLGHLWPVGDANDIANPMYEPQPLISVSQQLQQSSAPVSRVMTPFFLSDEMEQLSSLLDLRVNVEEEEEVEAHSSTSCSRSASVTSPPPPLPPAPAQPHSIVQSLFSSGKPIGFERHEKQQVSGGTSSRSSSVADSINSNNTNCYNNFANNSNRNECAVIASLLMHADELESSTSLVGGFQLPATAANVVAASPPPAQSQVSFSLADTSKQSGKHLPITKLLNYQFTSFSNNSLKKNLRFNPNPTTNPFTLPITHQL